MIIKDPVKGEIKDAYVSAILSENIKAKDINDAKKTITNGFNKRNRDGIIRLVADEGHRKALKVGLTMTDPHVKNDDLLKTMFERGLIDVTMLKKTIQDIADNMVEIISSIDFTEVENGSSPYLIYLEFSDPEES